MKLNFQKVLLIITFLFAAIVTLTTITYQISKGYLYFTNQSNLLVFLVLLIVIIGKSDFKAFDFIKFLTLISILVTGIVYNLMLRKYVTLGYEGPFLIRTGIQNELTHRVIPIFYTVYYFISNKNKMKIWEFYKGIIHPIAYFTIFLILGSITKFYPYPFMDVELMGLGKVLLTTIGIMLPILIFLIIGIIGVGNKILTTKEV
ncbi:MAG: Pr6Pr family membrane protein [Acholeplasma sp.]|nr:Pr6Pr family membrane protein [Acholeplasma sp.]